MLVPLPMGTRSGGMPFGRSASARDAERPNGITTQRMVTSSTDHNLFGKTLLELSKQEFRPCLSPRIRQRMARRIDQIELQRRWRIDLSLSGFQ